MGGLPWAPRHCKEHIKFNVVQFNVVCVLKAHADDEPSSRLTPLAALNLSKSLNILCFLFCTTFSLYPAGAVMSAVSHSAAWKMQFVGQLLQGGESLQQWLNENSRSVVEEIIACRNERDGFLSYLD